MTQARLNRLLGQLQRAGVRPAGDGELLEQFIERREEDAFAVLLRRHGPMVLGVCRRVLGNPHDAEDAFQATFLVLVRKADSVRPREAVGSWLYGVAYRTALEARARLARQRRREKQVTYEPLVEARPEDPWAELRPLLDREVHRLPDIYRLAIILCDLEGRSRKAAAEQLGVPEGTLSSRLAAARKKLAQRLSRHGLAFTAGTLALLLEKNATSAAVGAALATATTRAALRVAAGQAAAVSGAVATLTEGVLKTMFLAKVKTVTVVLLGVTVLGLGTGKLYYAADPGQEGAVPVTRGKAEQDRDGRKSQQTGQAIVEQERASDRVRQLDQARKAALDRERALMAEIELLKKEAAAQRDQAEAAMQVAEAERQNAEARLQEARHQLERARRAEAEARQGQTGNSATPPSRGGADDKVAAERENALRALKLTMDNVVLQFQARRQQLLASLKKLDAEREQTQVQLEELEADHQRAMRGLKQKYAEAASQQEIRPEQRKAPQPAAGDKLDRILEKLEHLERRLDRLEQTKR